MEKLNRQQRRAAKYGRHQAPTSQPKVTPWPESSPNPVFGGSESPADAEASAPDDDQPALTEPGTGGAIDKSKGSAENKGARAGSSTKS